MFLVLLYFPHRNYKRVINNVINNGCGWYRSCVGARVQFCYLCWANLQYRGTLDLLTTNEWRRCICLTLCAPVDIKWTPVFALALCCAWCGLFEFGSKIYFQNPLEISTMFLQWRSHWQDIPSLIMWHGWVIAWKFVVHIVTYSCPQYIACLVHPC